MAIKTYILQKKEDFDPSTQKEFYHYWINEGENFPDYSSIESFLYQNYDGYEWVEYPLKLIREDIKQASIELSGQEMSYLSDCFIKVIDDSLSIPLYYKSVDIRQLVNQNAEEIRYQIVCQLDNWSSFGMLMFSYLKSFPDELYIIRKMCDRYLFTSQGNFIDYNVQIWLKQQGNYNYPLVKDVEENSWLDKRNQLGDYGVLTLKKWAYINSNFPQTPQGFSDFTKNWENNYLNHGYLGVKTINGGSTGQKYNGDIKLTTGTSKWQNWFYTNNITKIKFHDENFNSNGLYRYLIVKSGNNLERQDKKNIGSTIFPKDNADLIIKNETSKLIFYSGEDLFLIPVLKDNWDDQDHVSATIKFLNTNHDGKLEPTESNLVIGSQSVIGSLINDIPPIILGYGNRYKNDQPSQYSQNLTDILGVRFSDNSVHYSLCCIVDNELKDNADMNIISGILAIPTSLNYLSIVLSKGNIYKEDTIDGNSFINTFRRLSSDMTTGFQNITDLDYRQYLQNYWDTSKNTLQVEPFLYAPQFYNWTYLTDGNNRLAITADMLDLSNINKENWKIWLNVVLGERGFYKLDLEDQLKNKLYPFTKTFVELTTQDSRLFPYSTESYYSWLQNNENTLQTARNSQNLSYAQTGIGALGRGIIDMMKGDVLGAFGDMNATGVRMGFSELQFQNEWKGRLGNMYQAPSQLSTTGFASGSLNYDTCSLSTEQIKADYKTFRTYTLPEYAKREIWNDISMYGYFFKSQDKFSTYDNRVNFNFIACDLGTKWFQVYNFLKQKTLNTSFLCAQSEWLGWFRSKIENGIRLFKCLYDESSLPQIIEGNIENNYQKPLPPINDEQPPRKINVFIDQNFHKFDMKTWATWDKFYLSSLYNKDWSVESSYLVGYVENEVSFNIEFETPRKLNDELWWTNISELKQHYGDKDLTINFGEKVWSANFSGYKYSEQKNPEKPLSIGKISDLDDLGKMKKDFVNEIIYKYDIKKPGSLDEYNPHPCLNFNFGEWDPHQDTNNIIGNQNYHKEIKSIELDFNVVGSKTKIKINLFLKDKINNIRYRDTVKPKQFFVSHNSTFVDKQGVPFRNYEPNQEHFRGECNLKSLNIGQLVFEENKKEDE